MAVNRLESSGAGTDAAKAAPEAAPVASVAPAVSGGGLKSWLPLILTLATMPALAYVTTNYLLLPRLQQSLGAAPAAQAPAQRPATAENEPGSPAAAKPAEGGPGKPRYFTQMNKVLVNLAGTLGTRWLVVNMTLVSKNADFEKDFRDNEPELRHIAITSLSSKTIADLEKPGAKNIIRSELTSLFNSVVGNGVVQDVYFTEFAVQ